MADEHSSVAEPATDPRTDGDAASPFLGPNAWLVEEMYEQYRSDPGSVSENWRDFFEDYRSSRPQPVTAAAPARRARLRPRRPLRPSPPRRRRRPPRSRAAAPPAAGATARRPGRQAHPRRRRADRRQHGAQPRRADGDELPRRPGQAARGQPEDHQRLPAAASGAGKISFTHLIGYAVVRTIADDMPVMNATFVEDADGKPRVVHHDHVNVGLAVDVEKSDGTRTLVVPVIKRGRHPRLRRLPRRVRGPRSAGPRPASSRSTDFQGATITHHQPGHHRHRPVGAPADARPGRDRRRRHDRLPGRVRRAPTSGRWASSAVSKVVTLTSTYDHRIIQGAESGMFLKARARAAARRARLLRRRLPRRSACPTKR